MSDGDISDIARKHGREKTAAGFRRVVKEKMDSPGNDEPDPFGPNGGEQASNEKPLRPMPSWISYGRKEVDRSQYHVGEGFIEIGGFVMLIGQSYAGKSTLIAQLSIYLAIGRSWLFFHIHRPLKVLVVQAEDPENKLIKMGHMYKRMGLNDEEIKLADQNTAVLTIRDLQDTFAMAEIERHAEAFKPDVVVINPMTSYLGGSVYKDDVINKFFASRTYPDAGSPESQCHRRSSPAQAHRK
jgi:hypothetical protein